MALFDQISQINFELSLNIFKIIGYLLTFIIMIVILIIVMDACKTTVIDF